MTAVGVSLKAKEANTASPRLHRKFSKLQGLALSSDGFPSLSVLKVILYPLLYRPFFNQFDPPRCPVTVFKRDIASFPFSPELRGRNSSSARTEKRINYYVSWVR